MKYSTGYSRGYIKIADREVEIEIKFDFALAQNKNSNMYKAAKQFKNAGCVRMTIKRYQHPRSSRYCRFVYTGYKEV